MDGAWKETAADGFEPLPRRANLASNQVEKPILTAVKNVRRPVYNTWKETAADGFEPLPWRANLVSNQVEKPILTAVKNVGRLHCGA